MNCDQLREIHIGVGSFYCYESFELKNLPSLISIQLDGASFAECHLIVFESMNDWMNDEWDLPQLQSITLGWGALNGDEDTIKSNELIMKSMNDGDDWLIRSPFANSIQRKCFQFMPYRQSSIREWCLMIVFDVDIPSLTEDGIQMAYEAFENVNVLTSSSMIGWLLMIKMLIFLINSLEAEFGGYRRLKKQLLMVNKLFV